MPYVLKKRSILILTVWLIVQASLLLKNGIVTTGEAAKYIREADSVLLTGKAFSPNFWLYATQSSLIAIDKILNAQLLLVVGIQMIFSLWATFSFYGLIKHIFSAPVAVLGTIIFLLNYPFQEFNTFLQTESLYNSLTIIFSAYLLTLASLSARSILVILVWLSFLTITRPTGVLLILPTLLYILFRFRQHIRTPYLLAGISAAVLFLLFVISQAMNIGGRFDFMLPFRTGQVICYVPEVKAAGEIKMLGNGNSLTGLVYYITHNFWHFSSLALKKCVAFFGLTRPYFSLAHNIFLVAFFYPVYLMSVLSLRYWLKEGSRFLLFLTSVVVVVLVTTILTCDDWHNRFFLSISPYLLILSIPVIKSIILPTKLALNDKGHE